MNCDAVPGNPGLTCQGVPNHGSVLRVSLAGQNGHQGQDIPGKPWTSGQTGSVTEADPAEAGSWAASSSLEEDLGRPLSVYHGQYREIQSKRRGGIESQECNE